MFMTDAHEELAKQFREETGTTGIDWDRVKKPDVPYHYRDEDNEQWLFRVYLGTVMSLAPSGKYWTWWACSNVDDEEMVKDSVWFTMLEEEALANDFWIETGEGDPCDLFAVRVAKDDDVDDDVKKLLEESTKELLSMPDLLTCRECGGSFTEGNFEGWTEVYDMKPCDDGEQVCDSCLDGYGTCTVDTVPCKVNWVNPEFSAYSCENCSRPPQGMVTSENPDARDNYKPYLEMRGEEP